MHTILIYEIKLGYNTLLPYLEDVLVLSASCSGQCLLLASFSRAHPAPISLLPYIYL